MKAPNQYNPEIRTTDHAGSPDIVALERHPHTETPFSRCLGSIQLAEVDDSVPRPSFHTPPDILRKTFSPTQPAQEQDVHAIQSHQIFLDDLALYLAGRLPVTETPAARLNRTLLPLATAEAEFGFSRVSFWRFRKRHRIRLLPGRRISVEDILAGFAAERLGRRRNTDLPEGHR
jgi:hypothetical protein